MEWSCLNSTLNKIDITDPKNCNNCSKPETTSNYLLQCKRFLQQRQNVLSYIELSVPNIKVTTDLLLNGSSELTPETNCKIMKSVQHFITKTGRFQCKPVQSTIES